MKRTWAQTEADRLQPLLRTLYKALNAAKDCDVVDGFDLDDILLGSADILNMLADPITVKR